MELYCSLILKASNENKVLYDFFSTGVYDRERPFILTSSPSMDILISSNLERLIYLSCGCDAEKTAGLMEELSRDGRYAVTEDMRAFMADFWGGYADEKENASVIHAVFRSCGYLMDTHTGVAAAVSRQYKRETGDERKMLIASTASPFKFSGSVLEAIQGRLDGGDEFAVVDELSRISGVPVPAAVEEIRTAPVRHTRECSPEQMEEEVADILGC